MIKNEMSDAWNKHNLNISLPSCVNSQQQRCVLLSLLPKVTPIFFLRVLPCLFEHANELDCQGSLFSLPLK